ncbi:MAG: hypothetical protein IT424_10990, partial [Pirellulales bacterium]|nr:hypothetical protein [Pirellulales bacterium]
MKWMKPSWRRLLAWAVVWAGANIWASSARSEEAAPIGPVQGHSSAAGGFRRVFVPVDRPDQWPTGGQHYLPVAREEFERLIDAAEERRQLGEAGGAYLKSARYAAELSDGDALRGRATLQVNSVDDEPRVLLLAPLNISVASPRWAGAALGESPVAVGAWARDGNLRYGALVRQDGALEFDWTAAPIASTAAELDYVLKLPGATASQLELTLPSGLTPVIVPGYVAQGRAEAGGAKSRYVLQLGPGNEHRLKIRRGGAQVVDPAALPSVAVSEAYQMRLAGLDYEAELRVDAKQAAEEISIKILGELQITEVLVDRRGANWRRDAASLSTIHIELPKSSLPVNVVVRGAAPTALDRTWQLPTIAPRACFWTEGTSTVWVDQDLELQQIEPSGAQLVNSVGIGGSEGRGEAYRLQSWSEEAVITVGVAARSGRIGARIGTTVQLLDREAAAASRARIWSAGGRQFQLRAVLAPDWTLESVEAEAPDEIVEWHVDEPDGQRQLFIQLRRSPTASNPLRLTLTGRKPIRGWARAATVEELNWISWPDADIAAAHLLVRDRNGGQVLPERLDAAGLMDATALAASSRELLDLPAQGVLLDVATADGALVLRASNAPARFDAEGWLELLHAPGGFEHRSSIVCRPAAGAVAELAIIAARPIPPEARWQLRGGDEPLFVEAVGEGTVESGAAAKSQPNKTSQYRVRLTRPQSDPFEIVIDWHGSDPRGDSVNSLAMPGAASWQSWAILRGDPEHAVLQAGGFTPAAANPDLQADDDRRRMLGCYRLTDDPFVPLEQTPGLVARTAESNDDALTITCSLLEIATLQFDDGRQTHRLAYHLRAESSGRLNLALPPELHVSAARLDGRTVVDGRRQAPRRVELAIGGRERSAILEVEVHGSRPALGSVASIEPPAIAASFPILRSRWSVSAPAQYLAVHEPSRRQVDDDWMLRLFGPLLRQHDRRVDPIGGLSRAQAASAASLLPGETAGGRFGSLAPNGWTTISREFVSAPRRVVLTHIGAENALWHLLALLGALAAAAWRPRHKSEAASLITAAAICALLVPAGWHQWPQALFLGGCAGAIARGLWGVSQFGASLATLRTAALAAICGASLGGASRALAEDQPAPAPPSVFFPVDPHGAQAGTDVYVPESLLESMLPAKAASRRGGASAVLLEANYRLELSPAGHGSEVDCSAATLRFRVRTFQPAVRLNLPLQQSDGQWGAELSTLDGAPVALSWNESGGCSVVLARPGVHELLLGVMPQTARLADRSQLSLHTPSLPGAKLEVTHPAGVVVGLASCVVDRAASSPTRTVAVLADQEVLECSWPSRARSSSAGLLRAEQLSWLNVESSTSTLEVRFDLTGDAAALDTLALAISPELKLLPLPDGSPVYELQSYPGSPTVIELKFRSPSQLPQSVALQFQLQRTASVGQFDLPRVRLLGVETTLHHFVVSSAPSLRLRAEPVANMTPLAALEAAQRWPGLPPMDLRYAVSDDQPRWSMRVSQSTARFAAAESLGLVCTGDEMEVAYTASVGSVEGEVLIHRLAIPTELRLHAAAVDTDGGVKVPVRWSRPRPDQLQVFLGRPLSASHTVRITGWLPYEAEGRARVPRIVLAGAAASPIQVAVHRTGEVLVEVDNSDSHGLAAPFSGEEGLRGLAASRFQMGRNDDVPPVLRVRENKVAVHSQWLWQLNPSATKPSASCIIHGKVASGVADSLDILADSAWRGPFSADAGVIKAERTLANDSGRRLIALQLARPIRAGEEFTLRMNGDLQLAADQRLRFPAVRPLIAGEHESYLMLPPAAGNQSSDWTLIGVQRAKAPDSLSNAAGISDQDVVYRIERDRFVAERRLFPDALRRRDVRLAYSSATVDEAGSWSAVSELIVQP